MVSFEETLVSVLKADDRFIDEERDLLRDAVVNAAYSIDKVLIKSLLAKAQLKKSFFTEIDNHWVFDIIKFVSYVGDKNFLNDSYTKYKNKIGLNVGGKFLKQRNEVALVWPFKDCVLEGGMTKEDQAKKEIFFNETLAADEIDKLFSPKVLTEGMRFSKTGKSRFDDFNQNEKSQITDNLVIKANNLLALRSLKEEYQGRVRLVYIDPPYYFDKNKKEDTFEYNSNFKLSSWLTFMKNRLEVAYDLLSQDGALFVQISDDGVGYLHQLLAEVFNKNGQNNFINKITIKTKSPSGFASVNAGVFETAEYVFAYAKDKKSWKFNEQYVESGYDPNYNSFVKNKEKSFSEWKIVDLEEQVAKINKYKNKKAALKLLGANAFNELVAEFALENSDRVYQSTAIGDNASGEVVKARDKSKKSKDKVIEVKRKSGYDVYVLNGREMAFYSKKIREIDGKKVPSIQLSNIWTDVPYEGIAREGGVKLKGGKKPEKLLKRIIEIATDEGDLVLDYHLGSGTTAAVAHKLGRQYIGIEQLDTQMEKSLNRLEEVIAGDSTGISKAVNWKGGGEFVYLELKQYNETFIEKIESASSTNRLLNVWKEMKDKAFFKHNFEMKKFESSLDEFKSLELGQQKKLLVDVLDKNQLYVNLSEIEDMKYKVSAEEKKLTNSFYGRK